MGQPVIHWEIAARDAKRIQQFFAALFDWQVSADNPWSYGVVETGGQGGINGGIFQTPDDVPPYLTFYVRVDDLQAYLDRAEALGGKTVMPPMPIPGIGAAAMFSTPEGHMVGLFKEEG